MLWWLQTFIPSFNIYLQHPHQDQIVNPTSLSSVQFNTMQVSLMDLLSQPHKKFLLLGSNHELSLSQSHINVSSVV